MKNEGMQVVFFMGSVSEVEEEINKWLKENPGVYINTIKQNADCNLTVISIWYTLEEEE